MATVRFDIAALAARRLDVDDTTWVIFGDAVPSGDVERLGLRGDAVAAADRFAVANRRSCIAYVGGGDGRPLIAGVRRGLLCQRDVFYRMEGGALSIDDVFRNAVRRVPVAERTPSGDALVEHYLFRRALPPLTYVPTIMALPTATAVDLDPVAGTASWRVIDRLDVTPSRRPPSHYVADIDEALSAAVADVVTPGAALMFSGGVDSTLLLTYCKDLVIPMTIVPDSPEFAVETGYADAAAEIAGVEYTAVPVRESDYGRLMRETVEQLAFPPVHDMMPFKPPIVAVAPDHEMMGLMSDSLFGLDSRALRTALSMRNPVLRAAASTLIPLAVGPLRRRARRLARRVATLHADPYGLDGAAANAFATGDIAVMSRIVGDAAVDGARARFLERFLARCRLQATEPLAANLEAVHMAIVVTGPGGSDTLLAEEVGHRLAAPFEDERVVEAALQIPADERFIRDGVIKWLPRRLIAQRLPGYPAYQEKKHTALPVARYYRSGPLADFWNRYELPELLDADARSSVLDGFSMTAWNAMSHALWVEHVGRNPNLAEYPATVSIAVSTNRGGGAVGDP